MNKFVDKIDYFFASKLHDLYLWLGDFATTIMKGISLIAEMGILFLLTGVILSLFKRTRKIGITILISVAIGFLLTNVILKNVIARARPFENKASDFFMWWLDAGAVNEGGYSFPSGHTTATTSFAMALFFATKKEKSWPILFLPLLMASSRIYLMVHYFSDCVGAFAVGTVSALIAVLLVKWIYKSKIKLFVWVRELNIFKTKNTTTAPVTPTEEQPKVEEFVYTTQSEENKEVDNQALPNKDNDSSLSQ